MTLQLVKSPPHPAPADAGRDLLDELYERHATDVKRWARRLAGPHADVEDLLHDVFVIALRRRFTFRGDANIKTWLFRITHHVVRARLRRKRVRGLLFGRHHEELAAALPSPSTPQDEAERHERHVRLYQALDRLSDVYRTTLILYEIDGLSGEEIAELTDVNLSAVWVRLHRGRAKLQALLAEEQGP
jgi:RNA polymerase sigma-70 factor (ECF subfamily)